MKKKMWINSGIGAFIWSALFFLVYFYLRATAYHVRYPDEQKLAYYRFMDQHLLSGWILGMIIIVLLIRLIISHRVIKSFDLTLDFMKEIWKKPEERVPIPPDMDEVYNLLEFFQNQLHETTKAIKQEQQRKNDLVVYLAHDLKTPLTSIQGYLDIILEQPELPDELKLKYTGIAAEKAERLEDLIDEFFDISRFNLTDIVIHWKQVNLERLVEQEVFEFQPLLREKNLRCEIDMEENYICSCDPDKMQRVIDNLLRNAVNYCDCDSVISVKGMEKEQNYYIDIENAGDTIPKESLERLFEQFFRLDSSRNSKSGGSGVGLAIARKIIEAHKGTLDAESYDHKIIFHIVWPKV